MPQLDMSTFPPQIIWLAISFGITFLIIWKVAAPKIDSVLEARQFRIEDNLAKAEEHKNEAEIALDSYEKNMEIAHKKANEETIKTNIDLAALISKRTEELDTKIKLRIAESDASIDNAVNTAIDNISEISEEVVIAMNERLTNEIPKGENLKKAIIHAVNEFN